MPKSVHNDNSCSAKLLGTKFTSLKVFLKNLIQINLIYSLTHLNNERNHILTCIFRVDLFSFNGGDDLSIAILESLSTIMLFWYPLDIAVWIPILIVFNSTINTNEFFWTNQR